MRWVLRTFGRSFVWKLGGMAALLCVAVLQSCFAQTITCESACTVTLDLQVRLLPFDMTVAEAGEIASAILAVWAVAWIYVQLHRAISGGKSTNEED